MKKKSLLVLGFLLVFGTASITNASEPHHKDYGTGGTPPPKPICDSYGNCAIPN